MCEWQAPEALKQILDLEIRDAGESHQKLLQLCRDVIQYSVKTSRNAISSEVVLYANLGRQDDDYSYVTFQETGVVCVCFLPASISMQTFVPASVVGLECSSPSI